MSGTYKKAAVIGYPVKHSLSPKLHGYWLKKYNINGEYGMLEVAPEDFEQCLKSLARNGYAGVNITVPYKERAYELVDETDAFARSIGAVNTIIAAPDGRLKGSNTDAYGFIENIKSAQEGFSFNSKKAVVLGAGGAARAVIAGLQNEGAEIILTNRTRERADEVKNYIGGNITIADWQDRNEILSKADLLVNTTTLGMAGQPGLDINLAKLPLNAIVTDIIYKPLKTKLLLTAEERGNKIVDGLGMLLYQAVPGFEGWFGVKPEVTEELREKVLGGREYSL